MSVVETSSAFCLFCYRSTKNPSLDYTGLLDSTKRFTKVLNRFTKFPEEVQSVRIVEDRLLSRFRENDKLLNYCSKCDTIIVLICEIYHQIKTLELQLDLKLDKLVENISFANKVPSRWVHITKTLEEYFQDDKGNIAASQKLIRDFRQHVVKAAQHRKQNSQPRVTLKRNDNESDNAYEFNNFKKSKIRDKLTGYMITYRKTPKTTVCQICGKKFKTLQSLHVHTGYHKAQEERKFECRDCGRKFTTHWNLRAHMKTHTGEKDFKCQFCGVAFAYWNSIKRHLKSQHGYEKGIEEKSNRKVKRGRKWKSNLEDNSPKSVASMTLPDCSDDTNEDKDDKMSSEENFEEEMPVDENTDRESFKEVEHDAAFVRDSLNQVKVEHTAVDENYENDSTTENESQDNITVCCEFCKIPFPGMTQLTKHIVDDMCSANNTGTVNHQNHTFSKDKTCPKCGKQLKTNFAYKIHLEWHKNPNEWKFKCEICGKRFYSKNNLNQHSKRHVKDSNNQLEISHAQGKCIENDINRMETENRVEQLEINPSPSLAKIITNYLANSGGAPTSENQAIIIKEEPPISFSNVEEIDTMDNDDNCDTEHLWENGSLVSSSFPAFIEERKKRPAPLSRQSTHDLSTPIYECEICTRKFKVLSIKERHFKLCHDLEGKRKTTDTYKCTIGVCTAYFLKYSQLRKHYNDDHQSSLPLETFDEAERKIRSIRSSRTPDYKCEICTRRFKIIGHKLHHFKVCHGLEGNSEADVFKCEMENCTAYFLKNHQLQRHYKVEHQTSEETEPEDEINGIWKCKKCGKKFVDNSGFLDHIREYRYKSCMTFKCKFCGITFPHVVKLNEHKSLLHKNEVVVKDTAEGNPNAEEDKVEGMETDTSGDKNDDTDNFKAIEINQVINEMVDDDPNVFGRTGKCLNSEALVELEDLD